MDIRVAAYGVITDAAGQVLLARWTQGRKPAWTMPGGGIDPGEDPADAVVREVWEETGYTVEVDDLVGVHSHVIPARNRLHGDASPLHALRIIYRVRITGGELRFEENGSTDMAAWFPIADIPELEKVSLVEIALGKAGLL